MDRVASLVALLLACTSGPPALPAGDPARPDVVLISIDTLRADHLSAWGYGRDTSPFLDGLASAGARFAQARSASPWTLPAHTTLLTGQLPATHHVVEDSLRLSTDVPVLPERMRAAGYKTGGFVSTLYVSRLFGFERGFDHFEDFDIHTEKANLSGEIRADKVIREAEDWWADQAPGAPVFLFLHFYDVHYEYDPPEPFASMYDRPPQKGDRRYKSYAFFLKHPLAAAQLAHQVAQYDEAIRYVDTQLQGLAAVFAKAGRQVRWVVTADHGEELGERGSWGHAHTLYPEQLHIPLIMSGPGIPAGRVVEERVGSHDIGPTIAAWAGGGLAADGVDLAPLLSGGTLGERPFLSETSRFTTSRLGLLEGGLRLDWDLRQGRRELYDEVADPTELHDLSTVRPEEVERLAGRALQLLGSPWTARAPGKVAAEGGVVLPGGHPSREVEEGDSFLVLPYDAPVKLGSAGPWALAGGETPGAADPLALQAATRVGRQELDEAQRKALEALGYLEEE